MKVDYDVMTSNSSQGRVTFEYIFCIVYHLDINLEELIDTAMGSTFSNYPRWFGGLHPKPRSFKIYQHIGNSQKQIICDINRIWTHNHTVRKQNLSKFKSCCCHVVVTMPVLSKEFLDRKRSRFTLKHICDMIIPYSQIMIAFWFFTLLKACWDNQNSKNNVLNFRSPEFTISLKLKKNLELVSNFQTRPKNEWKSLL